MNKAILLATALLAMSGTTANAGGFSFQYYSPAPVYTAPVYYAPPVLRPVVYSYPVAYSYYQPAYVHYNSWNNPKYSKNQCHKKGKHKGHGHGHGHDHHDD